MDGSINHWAGKSAEVVLSVYRLSGNFRDIYFFTATTEEPVYQYMNETAKKL
jgi:hypothetical protein